MSSHKYPASGGSSPYWGNPVASVAALPPSGTVGEVRLVLDVDDLYEWNGSTWERVTQNSADVTGPGSSTDNAIARFDGTTGKLLQNSSGATISDSHVITAAGFVGDLTGNVDVAATGGTDTLGIGTANADVVNIGRSGATVNIQGTTAYQNVTNYQVTDKNITVNKGGSAASGTSAGLEIEENSVVTGYAQTSGDRNSWVFKAPNTAGDATITPGAGGITLNQSSHDPVTIGTGNGLSLATQALSLAAASAGQTGALTSTDWSTFNGKQDAITGGATSILSANLTASRALVSDGSGKVGVATTTATEIGYVNGVTSAIQTQLNGKEPTITGAATSIVGANLTVSRAVVSDGSGKVAVATTTATEIGYVNGVTSAIQTQLNAIRAGKSTVTVSSNVTLTDQAIHLVDCSAARSLTLPAPSASSYIVVKDKTGQAATNNITIVRAGSEKIETVAASFTLDTDLGAWTFVSDGTDWFII